MEESKMGAMERIAKMNTLKPDEVEELEEMEETEEFDQVEDGVSQDMTEEGFLDEDSRENDGDFREKVEEKRKLQHTDNFVSVSATPTRDDMFKFLLRHTYFNPIGIIGVLFSLSSVVLLIMGYGRESSFTTILLVVVALMFTVINPISLFRKAGLYSQSACSSEARMTYGFSDAGIDMTKGEDYISFRWEDVYRIIETGSGFTVYFERNRAFIIPLHDIEGREDSFREIFRKNVVANKCKIRC